MPWSSGMRWLGGQQFYTVVANTASRGDQPGGRSGIYSTDPIYDIESRAFAVTDKNEVIVGRFRTLNGDHPQHWMDQHHYIGSRRPGALYRALLKPSTTRPPNGALQPYSSPSLKVASLSFRTTVGEHFCYGVAFTKEAAK